MQTTFTVKYNNAPKPGKKMGNLKDEQGNTYFGYPNIIGQVRQGQTVTIEYQTQNWNGKNANIVDRVLSVADGGGQHNGNAGSGGKDRATQRSIVAQSIIKALGHDFDEASADIMWNWHARRVHGDPSQEREEERQQQQRQNDGFDNNNLDDEIPF